MMPTPPPRQMPRFLPTLTEVVHVSVAAVKPASAAPDTEQLVDRVMQRLDVNLKAAIQVAINDMVRQQRQVLESILMREVELVVRQAVLESVGQTGSRSSHAGPPYKSLDPAQ